MIARSFILIILAAFPSFAAEWPQWRGVSGQGHAPTAKNLPVAWSETTNVAFKTAIPGRGWSSPVIDGQEIWLTTAIEHEASAADKERRLKANTGDQPLTVLEKVELRAICVDRQTGKVLHDVPLLTVKEPQWVHKLNSYASPTPALAESKLFAHFGAFGTACLDTKSAKVLWTNTELNIMHENGPGSSPIAWGDLVIFHMDGSDRQYVVALDAKTGKVAWKTDRSGKLDPNPQLRKSYATPMILAIGGQEQLISQGANWLYGYEPATGKELWKLEYGKLGFSLSAHPVVGHGMIFLSTGFMRPEIYAVRYEGVAKPEIAWKYAKGAPTMPSPLLVGDELYFLADSGGVLTCLDARTGKEHYRERLEGDHNASPIFADGKLYLPGRDGVTSVVAPGKEFKLLAKNRLPGRVFAAPAAVDGSLYLRTEEALYRIGS